MAIAVASAIGGLAIAGVSHGRCASANSGNGKLQFDGPESIPTRD
jgi:AAHS family benzoate transporter-like MFS transporter